MPASFLHPANHRHGDGSTTQPSVLYSTWNQPDAASIPLPQGRDEDLVVPHVIAELQGYIRSPKIVGSRHSTKGKSEKAKGKEKGNVDPEKLKKHARVIELDDYEHPQVKRIKKWSHTIEVDDNDDLPKVKRGHPQGANNYSIKDTNILLDLVEDELPHGQQGWTVVMTKYNKWATECGWPICKQSLLETKFKQVC